MRNRVLRHWLAPACAGLLAVLGCAGCGGVIPVTVTRSCSWTHPTAATSNPSPADAQSSTVVLMDISASYWPGKGGSKDLPDAPEQAVLGTLLDGFGSGGTRLVSLGTFDGSSATVTWQLGDVPLPGATGDAQEIQAQQQRAGDCLGPLVKSAVLATPQAPGTDVMAALGAAGSELSTTPAARSHVLLITDGMSNTGCLDLNKVLSQGESASDVVNSCPQQSALSRLRGADVRLLGIGFQALYPPMSTSQQSWLENYWRELCSALRVQSPESCVRPQTTDYVRRSNVTRRNDPNISFPSFPTAPGSRLVIPAPLLFAFDSATLTRSAESYLDILIQQIKNSGRPVIKVIGHTDSVGSAAYNLNLSLRRAQAVQAYLAAQGFTGIGATGVGFTQPACTPDHTPSGQPNTPCMARNRRVEIILGG